MLFLCLVVSVSWRECRFLLTTAAKKITPPPLSAPLKIIEFCGTKAQISLTQGAQAPHRAGFCVFRSAAKHAKKNERKAEFSPNFASRGKPTHRPPKLIKFLMPAAPHENKSNPAMVTLFPRKKTSKPSACCMLPGAPAVVDGDGGGYTK